MLARSDLNHILNDESLTRHLGDVEARVLIEWLVDQAEILGHRLPAEDASSAVRRLCRRGRAISHFVRLWAIEDQQAAALQFSASERFDWPLPDGPIEPIVLMDHILDWEMRRLEAA